LDDSPTEFYGRDACYRRDPRLFHPHTYFLKTHEKADVYNAGSLLLALPAGEPLISANIVTGVSKVVCFGDTLDELEYEYRKMRSGFGRAPRQGPPAPVGSVAPPEAPAPLASAPAHEPPAPQPDSSLAPAPNVSGPLNAPQFVESLGEHNVVQW